MLRHTVVDAEVESTQSERTERRSSVSSCILTQLCPFCSQINPGTVGFYRIQYSSAMLESLLPGVRDLSLQPVDRLGLQNDLFSLVELLQTHTLRFLSTKLPVAERKWFGLKRKSAPIVVNKSKQSRCDGEGRD